MCSLRAALEALKPSVWPTEKPDLFMFINDFLALATLTVAVSLYTVCPMSTEDSPCCCGTILSTNPSL
jgi:hypothetical protein